MSYAFQVASKTFSNGAISNTTAPSFTGLASITPNDDGSFTFAWPAATGSAAAPIRYEAFVALGAVSAATLIQDSNRVALPPGAITSAKIFTLRDQTTYFAKDQVITGAVRAVSAQNVSDTNTVTLNSTAIGTGNLPALFREIADELAATEALLSTIADNAGRAVPALKASVVQPDVLTGRILE